MISMHSLRVWVSLVLTCVLGINNWRKPPEGNRGRDGMSVPWKFCNDAVLSGKMLVECYLAEDSCMRDEERREKGKKRWWYPGKYLLRPPEKVAAGATAFSQYSTTAPATVWPQVPKRQKSYLHIVVVQIWAGVVGKQRKSTR